MGASSTVDLEPIRVPPRETSRRVANLDILRALAALAVLGVHAYSLGGRSAPVRAQYWYDVPLITLASGVWLFFAISGYVISRPFVDRLLTGKPLPPPLPYAARRGLRIFPLYWVALTAVIVIDGTAGTRGWQLPFHYLLLNNLIPGRQQALFPAAWTLTLEALFYISVPLLAYLVASRRRPTSADRLAILVIASWGASVAFTIVADLLGDGQIGLWLRGSLPAMWQMFCPGILLAITPHLHSPRWRAALVELPRRRPLVAAAMLAFAAAAVLSAAGPLRFGVIVYQLLADAGRPLFAFSYGILLAAAIASPAVGDRAWSALELGLVSYGIYLIHPVIVDLLLRGGLSPLHRDTALAFALNTGVLAALTVPLAVVSWRWLERPLVTLGRSSR